jgi:hypothetical protein
MTQVVRYGRMLKANINGIRVQVHIGWEQTGSVLAGTQKARCTHVDTDLEIDSDDDEALIASVIHNAKDGCYAEVALRDPIEIRSLVTLNGHAFNHQAYPKRPPSRRA